MKKIQILFLFMLLISLSACRTNSDDNLQTLSLENYYSDYFFSYPISEEFDAMTVDENGNVYTFLSQTEVHEEIINPNTEDFYSDSQTITVYSKDGSLVMQKKLLFSNSWVTSAFVENGLLYCVAGKSSVKGYFEEIYSIDLETWEVTDICPVTGYNRVTKLTRIGDYFMYVAV